MKSITLLFFTFSFTLGFSQWSTDSTLNNAICTEMYDQQDLKITEDGKGGAIVSWLDYRNDPLLKAGDVFVQRIDANGFVKWIANGVAVCTNASDQYGIVIESDGVGGAYLAWVDRRSGNRDIYAQHLDSNGVAKWTADGIAVCTTVQTQQNVRIVSNGVDGCILVWEDQVSTFDVFVQKLNDKGIVQWTAQGVNISSSLGDQINPKAVSDQAGGVIVTWQDKRNGSDYDIYAQRISTDGIALWTANGKVICNYAGTQSNPKIASDFNGGAVIAWQDKRNGLDYDIYAQYIKGDGATSWLAGGKAVSAATGSQSAIDMTSELGSGVVLTWKDSRQGNSDIYAQKINFSGAIQWLANGMVVVNSVFDQINPNVISDDNGGAIVTWQDSSSGSWDIRAQHLLSVGTLDWNVAGKFVSAATNHQVSPKNCSDGNGGSIFAFQDFRNGSNYDIYAYKIQIEKSSAATFEYHLEIVSIFPNPSNGVVNFEVLTPSSSSSYRLTMYNSLGEQFSTSNFQQHFSTGDLSSGIYFYNISDSFSNESVTSGKIIVE